MSRLGMARCVSFIVVISMMVSTIPMVGVSADHISMVETAVQENVPDQVDTSVIVMEFDRPTIEVIDGESYLSIGESQRYYNPCRPDLVYEITNLEFGPEFRLVDVFIEPSHIEEVQLEAPIKVQPDPIAIGINGPSILRTHDIAPYEGEMFPEVWGKYYMGRGLNSNDDPTVFLNFFAFPARVQDDSLFFTNRITFTFTHYNAQPEVEPLNSRAEDYTLIIIGPSSLSTPIGNLVDHKVTLGLTTKFATTDDIYTGKYFSTQGVDNQEKIKYFIKNAMENWNTKFVLLFGDVNQVPAFYVPYTDSFGNDVPIDIYYADIYGASGGFSDWSNAQGSTGSFTMPDDLYIDVHVGRLPAETITEANTVVNKVITYENDNDKGDWFKTAILIGSDPFTWAAGNEGDIGMDFIAGKIQNQFTNIKKLYEANGKNDATNIKSAINAGGAIVSYAGHGSNTYWGIGGGKSWSNNNVATTTNGDMLGIGSQAACLTGIYDDPTDSYSEFWLLKNGGGGIANMGASRVGYGSGGNTWPHAVAGAFNNRLYSSLMDGHNTLGSMYTGGHTNYMNTIGVNGGTDFKTVIEFIWFAEPSMSLGVAFDITREDPPLLIPEQSNEFKLTINNSGFNLGAELRTNAETIPAGFEVTFMPSKVTVPSGSEIDIRVSVTPDRNAQANTEFDLPIQVYGTGLERVLYEDLVPVKVAEIFGMEIDADYPTVGKNLEPGETLEVDVQVSNMGNTVETIDFELVGVPQGWDVALDENKVDLGFKAIHNVTLSIKIPDQNAPSTETILVKGKVANDMTQSDEHLFNVNVKTVHNWSIDHTGEPQNIDMGTGASFNIDLINDGNIDEVIDLEMTGPPNWEMVFDTPATIDPYSTRTIIVQVDVPEFEYMGDYTLQLSADNKATGDSKVIDLGVGINPAPDMDFEILDPYLEIAYMEDSEAGLSIGNLGNTMIDVQLSVSDAPEGWEFDLSQDVLTLPAKESGYSTVFISNPEFTVAGNYTITLLSTATYAEFTLTDEVELVVNVGQYHNATASIDEAKFQVDPGETVSAELLIENMGNTPEEFTDISAVAPDGWKVLIASDSETVDPFSTTPVKVQLSVPEDALTGMYRATLFAKNEPSNFVFTLDILVKQIFGFEGEVDKGIIEMFKGQMELVYLNLTNLGNGKDLLTIEMTSETWVLLDKTSIKMEADDAVGSVRLTATPGSKVKAGDYPVTLKVSNEAGNEETYTLTITVKERPQSIMGPSGAIWGMLSAVLLIVVVSIVVGILMMRRKAIKTGDTSVVAQIPQTGEWQGSAQMIDQPVSLLNIDDIPEFHPEGDTFN